MDTKEAYKKKLEAELEVLEAKILTLKAKLKAGAADMRLENSKMIDELEKKIGDLKIQLKKLEEAGEGAWNTLKEATDKAFSIMSQAVRDAISKFK